VKTLATIAFLFLTLNAFAQWDTLNISTTSVSLDTLASITNKLEDIEASTKGRIDSVTQYYNHSTDKIRKLSSSYQHKIDSLVKRKLPTEKYTRKLDSLNNVQNEMIKKAEAKIQSIKQKATDKLNAIPVPPELQSKVSSLTSALDKIDFSTVSSGIDSPINLKDMNTTLDQIIPSADLKGIPNLPSVEGLPDVTENLGSVSDLTSGVGEHAATLQQGAGEITQGVGQLNNIDQLAESQAMKLGGVKELQSAMGETPNLMPNEEQVKQQVVQQVQTLAVDHFAGKEEILQAGMDKLAKYKNKYESLPNIGDAKKILFSDLKNKPLIERLMPGIQFQVLSKQGNWMIDFNAYEGYRLNSKFTSGLGWNQRMAYNHRSNKVNPQARIFGPRAFSEYKLGKGFFPRIELEVMNSAVPPYTSPVQTVDSRSREWIWSGFIGMKKEYRFFKNVKGTTTIMVNAFHPHGKNLYSDVVCTRFGFEFPMKKKTKSNPGSK
jgi:hypothetical protein